MINNKRGGIRNKKKKGNPRKKQKIAREGLSKSLKRETEP